MINRAVIQVLKLRNVSIFDQLVLEEALFRVDGRNWFIWNQDTAPTAIVMGISGKPEKLVHMDRAQQDEIPLIKRFSGGGTVIVDENTIFTTFILDRASVPDVKPYPREIMDWSGRFFQPVFDRLCPENVAFHLREDDYAFGELKVGGNAQSISQGRWLHHTSFLWDFKRENMEYLQLPQRQPKYRQDREHDAFLCKLGQVIESKEAMYQAILDRLDTEFKIEHIDIKQVESIIKQPHRKSTRVVPYLEH